jgi:hypothetical protein
MTTFMGNPLQDARRSAFRRGRIFVRISQVLLVPAVVCFTSTAILHFGGRNAVLLRVGRATGMIQIPCVALALLLAFAAGMGNLLPRKCFWSLCGEVAIALAMITLVFVWRGVYGG